MANWKQREAAHALLERESGAIFKDPGGKLTVALAYPNTYHVGMSSLALHTLYRLCNAHPHVACERVFWEEGAGSDSLVTLETQADAQGMDVLAFSISFELDYFHVVEMLQRAGIPPRSADRAGGERWPLVIGGGPAVSMNPEPLAPLFDAFLIGEAEEAIGPLLDRLWATHGGEREEQLAGLASLPGIYIPDRMEPGTHRVARLWVSDPAAFEAQSVIFTPDTELGGIHLIEIARGCGRGCRYCLAGYAYRPPREQPLERVLGWAKAAIEQHGERIGLVSAAVSDHTHIDELATELAAMGARISVSSMRTDPISRPLLETLAAGNNKTLTIAPEAGSARLRGVINKPQSEESLLQAVELAQELGFPQLKMYFMVGHPGETDEDIDAIVDLSLKARRIFRRRIAINATPFVPKAHTPFQWSAMLPAKILQRRQAALRHGLAPRQVIVEADSPAGAELQGVLARGDRRLAELLIAEPGGAPRRFMAAMREAGLDPEEYLGERSPDAALPWDVVASGVEARHLQRERRLSDEGRAARGCPPGGLRCRACGVCVEPAEAGDHFVDVRDIECCA